ncbi:transcriptional regulator PadR family [Vibrio astriarenae]|nr:transcriptional regulator PadR family [Vibrio sp. C7]
MGERMKSNLNELATTILHLIGQKPMTGYDLTQTEEIGITRPSSHQQIYRECRNLVKDGLIEFEIIYQEGKPDKKQYCITGLGQQLLSVLQSEYTAPKLSKLRINDAPYALIGNRVYLQDRINAIKTEIELLEERLEEDLSPMLILSVQHLIDLRYAELRFNQGALKLTDTPKLQAIA